MDITKEPHIPVDVKKFVEVGILKLKQKNSGCLGTLNSIISEILSSTLAKVILIKWNSSKNNN